MLYVHILIIKHSFTIYFNYGWLKTFRKDLNSLYSWLQNFWKYKILSNTYLWHFKLCAILDILENAREYRKRNWKDKRLTQVEILFDFEARCSFLAWKASTTAHTKVCTVESLTSERTPSAIQFFTRSYEISHPPWL